MMQDLKYTLAIFTIFLKGFNAANRYPCIYITVLIKSH